MLTSLSQFQAQGWKKWLSRIIFTRRTNYLKSFPIGILSVLPSPSAFKLTAENTYSDSQINEVYRNPVLSSFPGQNSYLTFLRKAIYLYLTFNSIAKANVTVFAIR